MSILDSDLKKRQRYDLESEIYDRTRYGTSKGDWYRQMEASSIQHLHGLPPDARVIDVAAGTGRFTEELSRHPWKVFAVDQSVGMIEKLRERIASNKVKIAIGNARILPYRSDTFDAVTSFKFLHLFSADECQGFVSEMARILKPGGLLMVEFNNALYGVIWGWIRDMLDCWVLRKKKTFRTVLWPHQIGRVFSGLTISKRHGVWFPGSGALSRVSPSLAKFLEKLGRIFPMCYLTSYLIIVARKDSD
jgi:ubiquinone/menaquinone biosynthesis C-methylase UbiE